MTPEAYVSEVEPDRPASRVAGAAVAAGIAAFGVGLAAGHLRVALAALAASWLFFAGLSAGSVAFLAAVRLARGRWATPVLPIAEAAVAFFTPALLLLAVLLAGAHAFLPWAAAAGNGRLALLAARQLVPTTALFLAGERLVATVRRHESDGAETRAAVTYLVLYAVALSLWAYDWVLSLSSAPPTTVLPAYYFLGAFLCGLAWVALVAGALGVGGADLRHDLGKLLFGFVVVWSYLLWAIYLAAWYGAVPAEVRPLLARWTGPYRPAAGAVLMAVFLGPFALLLPERTKRRRGTLMVGAGAILLGLLGERFLLVLPALALEGGVAATVVGAGIALGVAGLFTRRVVARLPSAPRA